MVGDRIVYRGLLHHPARDRGRNTGIIMKAPAMLGDVTGSEIILLYSFIHLGFFFVFFFNPEIVPLNNI